MRVGEEVKDGFEMGWSSGLTGTTRSVYLDRLDRHSVLAMVLCIGRTR